MLKDMFIKEHEEALKATKKVRSLVIPPWQRRGAQGDQEGLLLLTSASPSPSPSLSPES